MWDAVVRKDPGSCSMGRGLCADAFQFSNDRDEGCFLVQSLHNSFLKCSEEQISTHTQHLLNRFWTTTSLLSLTGGSLCLAWGGGIWGLYQHRCLSSFPRKRSIKKKIITQIIWQLLYPKDQRTQWNLLSLRHIRSFKTALPCDNIHGRTC